LLFIGHGGYRIITNNRLFKIELTIVKPTIVEVEHAKIHETNEGGNIKLHDAKLIFEDVQHVNNIKLMFEGVYLHDFR